MVAAAVVLGCGAQCSHQNDGAAVLAAARVGLPDLPPNLRERCSTIKLAAALAANDGNKPKQAAIEAILVVDCAFAKQRDFIRFYDGLQTGVGR